MSARPAAASPLPPAGEGQGEGARPSARPSDGWGYPAGYGEVDETRRGEGRSVMSASRRPAHGQAAPPAPAHIPPAVALGLARSLRAACLPGTLGWTVADELAKRCLAEIQAGERRRRRR